LPLKQTELFGLGAKMPTGNSKKTDGTIWAWGNNDSGQLGQGNITDYSSPVQVGALTTWDTISAGGGTTDGTCEVVKTDGTLWTWGSGGNGRLGHNNTTSYSSPVQVGALTTWSKPMAGKNFMQAIKTDGTLWTWGSGTNGKLAQGNTTDYSSPVQIGALSTWNILPSTSTAQSTGMAIKN